VLKADTTNLDVSMLNFLRCYFPKEAKQKQKENDQEVLAEQWNAVHQERLRISNCKVM
jgi:E3 ubiquitin-protein ligase BAH